MDNDNLKDQASSLSSLVKQGKEILQSIQNNIDDFLLDIPNILDESVPIGEDETSNQIIEEDELEKFIKNLKGKKFIIDNKTLSVLKEDIISSKFKIINRSDPCIHSTT